MFDFFVSLSPIYQALIASLFTWSITSLGSAVVFFFKEIRKGIMDALLGFSAGVMIAASFWSLLSPAIEMAESLDLIPWLVAFSGFACGGLLLYVGDKIYTLAEKKKKRTKKDGPNIKRCLMLVVSITLHNIPEGLVIGVAFCSLAYNIPGATVLSAIKMAIIFLRASEWNCRTYFSHHWCYSCYEGTDFTSLFIIFCCRSNDLCGSRGVDS